MSGRKEIADILEQFSGLPKNEADHLAGMIVAAGYGKQVEQEEMAVYGYGVVGRDGTPVKGFELLTQQDAIDLAAEWTRDAEQSGIDYSYNVVAIVDQGGL